jgi:hypothetical protein
MRQMRTTKNVVTGFVVVAVCVACAMLIYHFTVGAKVSSQAPESPSTSSQAPAGVGAPAGSGVPNESHAVEVPGERAVTKPEADKRPLPPGREKAGG